MHENNDQTNESQMNEEKMSISKPSEERKSKRQKVEDNEQTTKEQSQEDLTSNSKDESDDDFDDIDDFPAQTYFNVYKGHISINTIKGVNFFGPKSEFVMSGSDDARIYIWDKKTTELLTVLEVLLLSLHFVPLLLLSSFVIFSFSVLPLSLSFSSSSFHFISLFRDTTVW
jgi:hypothetical protein